MKEKLYTIPLNDAFAAHDECPFCFIERKLEEDLLDFLLGNCSSYMESDVRSATDQEGFCRYHLQKMYDYGNTLGNGWILKTHYDRILQDMKKSFTKYSPSKSSFLGKKPSEDNTVTKWLHKENNSCYVCSRMEETFNRYLDTFFVLYEKEEEFREKVRTSKGFCLSHLEQLCTMADQKLKPQTKEEFYHTIFTVMEDNMTRMSDDISWLIDKFDYRYADADWKNSKDAIQRGMQKLRGGYPADLPYKANR